MSSDQVLESTKLAGPKSWSDEVVKIAGRRRLRTIKDLMLSTTLSIAYVQLWTSNGWDNDDFDAPNQNLGNVLFWDCVVLLCQIRHLWTSGIYLGNFIHIVPNNIHKDTIKWKSIVGNSKTKIYRWKVRTKNEIGVNNFYKIFGNCRRFCWTYFNIHMP